MISISVTLHFRLGECFADGIGWVGSLYYSCAAGAASLRSLIRPYLCSVSVIWLFEVLVEPVEFHFQGSILMLAVDSVMSHVLDDMVFKG